MHGQKVGIWTKSVVYLMVVGWSGQAHETQKSDDGPGWLPPWMQSCHHNGGILNQPYSHALVTRINHYLCRETVTVVLTAKGSKTKPSVKASNCNNLMPTRYSVNISFDKLSSPRLSSETQLWSTRSSLMNNLTGQEQMVLPEALAVGVFSPR